VADEIDWPFGRLAVALELLVADRGEAKADVIGLQHLFVVEEIHLAVGLVDLDLGDFGAVIALELSSRSPKARSPPRRSPTNRRTACPCPPVVCLFFSNGYRKVPGLPRRLAGRGLHGNVRAG
jgi:hypothetical protein